MLLEGDTIDEAQVLEAAEFIYEIVHSVTEQLFESRTSCLWFQHLALRGILKKTEHWICLQIKMRAFNM